MELGKEKRRKIQKGNDRKKWKETPYKFLAMALPSLSKTKS